MPASDSPRTEPGFTTLDHLGFVALQGARAVEFLQGQLTCDMRQASVERTVAGAWCTPKGRVLCSLVAWPQEPDRVILRMHADLTGPIAEQLSRYAALSRVRISPSDLHCLALMGTLDTGARDRLGLPPTAGAGAITRLEGGALLQLDAEGTRNELWIEGPAASAWCQRLRGVLPERTVDDWNIARIRAGIADIQAATRDLFLPQMLGYDSDGRVSFRKGCYTGQEIVARTHYKGGVKRHLHRLEGGGEPPPAGTPLACAGQTAGTVVESARAGDGRCELLAVLGDEFTASASGVRFVAGGMEFHLLA